MKRLQLMAAIDRSVAERMRAAGLAADDSDDVDDEDTVSAKPKPKDAEKGKRKVKKGKLGKKSKKRVTASGTLPPKNLAAMTRRLQRDVDALTATIAMPDPLEARPTEDEEKIARELGFDSVSAMHAQHAEAHYARYGGKKPLTGDERNALTGAKRVFAELGVIR